ncbi:MAG: hypothetical protein Q4A07_04315 [Coriobacteriales bacterium]|nr:hypothetical protein [Coriobacteriales bacterium]
MRANPTLLHRKYARVVALFARETGLSYDDALRLFYGSQTYLLMREGVSDLHCMSDGYLADELKYEYHCEPDRLSS